jgi:hypothetical protein
MLGAAREKGGRGRECGGREALSPRAVRRSFWMALNERSREQGWALLDHSQRSLCRWHPVLEPGKRERSLGCLVVVPAPRLPGCVLWVVCLPSLCY